MNVKQLIYRDEPLVLGRKQRIVYGVLTLACCCLGWLLSATYRPYIYANHINDFHIADTLGNLVAVPAAYCFFYAQSKKVTYTNGFILLLVWFIWLIYELIFSNTFDWYDILATTLMCLVMYLILGRK
jgi:hypothetical protein